MKTTITQPTSIEERARAARYRAVLRGDAAGGATITLEAATELRGILRMVTRQIQGVPAPENASLSLEARLDAALVMAWEALDHVEHGAKQVLTCLAEHDAGAEP